MLTYPFKTNRSNTGLPSLLNLNGTQVIPAVWLTSLDREFSCQTLRARIQQSNPEEVFTRFKRARNKKGSIKNHIAWRPNADFGSRLSHRSALR